MRTAIVQIKTETDIKEKCARLFESLGINISDAVNMFFRQSLLRGGLSFEVALPRPNAETLAAVDDVRGRERTATCSEEILAVKSYAV